MSGNKIVAIAKRENGKLVHFMANVPLWIKETPSKRLLITLPFLGLEFVVKDESRIQRVVESAVKSMCLIAENYGQGIESELEELGWTRREGSDVFKITAIGFVQEKLYDTGYQLAFDVAYA